MFASEDAGDGRADDEAEEVNEGVGGHGEPDGAGEEIDEGQQQSNGGGGDDSDRALVEVGEAEEERGEHEGRNGMADEDGEQKGQEQAEIEFFAEACVGGQEGRVCGFCPVAG